MRSERFTENDEFSRLHSEVHWLEKLKRKRYFLVEDTVGKISPETWQYLDGLDRLIELQNQRLFSDFSLETHIEVLENFEDELDEERSDDSFEIGLGEEGKRRHQGILNGQRKLISDQLTRVLTFSVSDHQKLLEKFENDLITKNLNRNERKVLERRIENQKGLIVTKLEQQSY